MRAKAVFVGDSGVGKTCLYDRLIRSQYNVDVAPTVGCCYGVLTVTGREGTRFDIALWDTAGQERYQTLIPMYFERANFLILVYSITDPDSFTHIGDWLTLAETRGDRYMKIILLGNKCDLDDKREVSFDSLPELGTKIDACLALEVSARTALGIEDVIQGLADGCVALKDVIKETTRIEDGREAEPETRRCC
jgi:small GTP-binding protein